MFFFRFLLWLQIFFNRWIWAILISLIGIYFLFGVNFTPYAKNDSLLQKSSLSTKGVITGIDVTKDFKAFFSDFTEFRYEYRTPDQEDITSFSYTKGFEKLNVGDTVSILMLPENYYISCIKGMECSRFDRRAANEMNDWINWGTILILLIMFYEGWKIRKIFSAHGIIGKYQRRELTENEIGNWRQEQFYYTYTDALGEQKEISMSAYRPSIKALAKEQQEIRLLLPPKKHNEAIAYDAQPWFVKLVLRSAFPAFAYKQPSQKAKIQTQTNFSFASILLFADLFFNKWALYAIVFIGTGYFFHGVNYSSSVEMDKQLYSNFGTTKGIITGFNTRKTAESIFSDLTEFRYEYRTPDQEDITSYSYAWGFPELKNVGDTVLVEYSQNNYYLSRIQGMSCSRYDPMAWRKVSYWGIIALIALIFVFVKKVKRIHCIFTYRPAIAHKTELQFTGNEIFGKKQVKISFQTKKNTLPQQDIWLKTYNVKHQQILHQPNTRLLIPSTASKPSIAVECQKGLVKLALNRMFPN